MLIAVVVGVVCVLSLVGAIVMGVQLAKINTQLSHVNGNTTSNCVSQGGTDPAAERLAHAICEKFIGTLRASSSTVC